MPALAINLSRSTERWNRISETVSGSGVELERIEAVDGSAILPADRSDFDAIGFARCHGRTVLDGEYGCYMSHLLALERVKDRGYPLAIICEDDIGLTRGLGERVASLFEALPQMELVKLISNRTSGFVSHGRSALGDEFGRCMHGPQGCAACYAVSLSGATKLLASLRPMRLPYDIALDRGWATGVSTFTTRVPLVSFYSNATQTTIATDVEYRQSKLPKLKRVSTALFRGVDYVSRSIYSLGTN